MGSGAVKGQEPEPGDLGDMPRHGAKEASGWFRAGSAAWGLGCAWPCDHISSCGNLVCLDNVTYEMQFCTFMKEIELLSFV